MFDKFRLKDVLVKYKQDFVPMQWGNEKYKWEAVKCFQDNWDVNAAASQIPWALDDGIGTMLPIMQSDITLSQGSRVLIIDAKYYTHTMQTQYDVHTLHSNNLYQIFIYVKNKDTGFGEEPHS